MCINPTINYDGRAFECRKCWQCRENKVNDWVGRCIAETKTCTSASFVTLTYGPDEDGNEDHPRAAFLTYSDVQLYFKRLRNDGFQFKYLAVGEYGSTKGRAHWHILLFFNGPSPEPQGKRGLRVHCPYWAFKDRNGLTVPRGFVQWDRPDFDAIRYAVKYIQKDIGKDERQGHLSMSKKPPIGALYFRRLAGQYVEQGLAPQAPYYSFPEVTKNGTPRQFHLHGKSLDIFCDAYLSQWRYFREGHHPHSDMIEEYCDRITSAPALDLVGRPVEKRDPPWLQPPSGAIRFSPSHNAWYADQDDGTRLFWSFDNNGDRAWQSVIRGDSPGRPIGPKPRPEIDNAKAYRDASSPSQRPFAPR